MAAGEREFRAQTSAGELVGWLREGPAGAPNAVLLHGGPGLNEYLDTLADELECLLTIARYQQRGLAPSAMTGPKDVEAHVADAVAVMNALEWERPIVIGHSWGGHLAMHLAVAHPDRVSAVVILDALGATGDGGIAAFGPNLRRGLTDAQLARLDEIDALESPTADELREDLGILWPNYFGDPGNAPPMPHLEFDTDTRQTWESINRHFEAGTLEKKLPNVQVPALVVHGELSPIPLSEAEAIAALMPNATLVEHRGMGHWAWLEEPGFIRAEMQRFLAEP